MSEKHNLCKFKAKAKNELVNSREGGAYLVVQVDPIIEKLEARVAELEKLAADATTMLRLLRYLYDSPDVLIEMSDRVVYGAAAEKRQQELDQALSEIRELLRRHESQ